MPAMPNDKTASSTMDQSSYSHVEAGWGVNIGKKKRRRELAERARGAEHSRDYDSIRE